MLVLSRKPGEKIYIGSGIAITLLRVNGSKVRIGIEAPEEVAIMRGELSFDHFTVPVHVDVSNGRGFAVT